MEELKNFTADFEKMLAEFKEKESAVASLNGQKDLLQKEIAKLEQEQPRILKEIEISKQTALNEIQEMKANSDRVFKQEDERITLKGEKQFQVGKTQDRVEQNQKQIHNELIVKETDLIKIEKDIKHREVNVISKEKLYTQLKEEAVALNAKAAQQEKINSEQLKAIAGAKKDLTEGETILRSGQNKLQQDKATQESNEAMLQATIDVNNKRSEELDKQVTGTAAEIKKLEALQLDIKVQRKNLSDKENSIRAMSAEIDLKTAKLKKGIK